MQQDHNSNIANSDQNSNQDNSCPPIKQPGQYMYSKSKYPQYMYPKYMYPQFMYPQYMYPKFVYSQYMYWYP